MLIIMQRLRLNLNHLMLHGHLSNILFQMEGKIKVQVTKVFVSDSVLDLFQYLYVPL